MRPPSQRRIRSRKSLPTPSFAHYRFIRAEGWNPPGESATPSSRCLARRLPRAVHAVGASLAVDPQVVRAEVVHIIIRPAIGSHAVSGFVASAGKSPAMSGSQRIAAGPRFRTSTT
jgi:hypothetical protein